MEEDLKMDDDYREYLKDKTNAHAWHRMKARKRNYSFKAMLRSLFSGKSDLYATEVAKLGLNGVGYSDVMANDNLKAKLRATYGALRDAEIPLNDVGNTLLQIIADAKGNGELGGSSGGMTDLSSIAAALRENDMDRPKEYAFRIYGRCGDDGEVYSPYIYDDVATPPTPKGVQFKGGLKMDSTEKWNKVVDFYQKNRTALEAGIQKDWETICSEILGYKVIYGNMEAQKHVAYATGNPIKIDILLRKDNQNVCIVELKQHQPLDKKWQEQLFTYLKQMKVKIGVLVCDKIYLYSYDFAKDDSNQPHVIVDFERNNPDGIRFIDMFAIDNFNEDAISTFIIEQGGRKQNVKEIQAQINEILLYDLLKKHFVPKYPVEDFNAAIQNMNIHISAEIPVTIPDVPFMPKDKDENDLDKSEIYTICRKNGINLPHNHNDFTKAKLNNGVPKYWANPNKKLLSQEWWLTLVDINKRELHVFRIPANSIRAEQLKFKSPNLIDLQIHYNDHHHPNFTDSRSGIDFKQWLVKTIRY